jgi:tetratricopeptide (TPR) repeat protein
MACFRGMRSGMARRMPVIIFRIGAAVALMFLSTFPARPAGAGAGVGADAGRPEEVVSWRHRILSQAEYERLVTEWEAYAKAHPEDVRAMVELGDALRYARICAPDMSPEDRSADAYKRAFAADSTNAAAIEAYVTHDIINQVGDFHLAYQRLVRAMKADPGYAQTYYSLHFAALRAGNKSLAKKCLEQVVKLGDMPKPLYDFGYNLLAGAPRNAIVFTNGDNDTYPPLAAQAVEGFRTDVSIVNVSLLNLQWYVRYLRDNGVPIPLNDSEIEALEWTKEATVSAVVQRALYDGLKKGGTRPIAYAVTVNDKAIGAPRVVTGLVEIVGGVGGQPAGPTSGAKDDTPYNVAETRRLFDKVFRLASFTDPSVNWDRENVLRRLGLNYVTLLSEIGFRSFRESPPVDGAPYLSRAIAIATFHRNLNVAKEILERWEAM